MRSKLEESILGLADWSQGSGKYEDTCEVQHMEGTCIRMPCMSMKSHQVISLIRQRRDYISYIDKSTVAALFYISEIPRKMPCILFIIFLSCAICLLGKGAQLPIFDPLQQLLFLSAHLPLDIG